MYPADLYYSMYHLVCVNCGATYPADEIIYNCRKCGHLLAVKYQLDEITITKGLWEKRPLSVWRYRELLPVKIDPVTLGKSWD
jgi:threonine synthase